MDYTLFAVPPTDHPVGRVTLRTQGGDITRESFGLHIAMVPDTVFAVAVGAARGVRITALEECSVRAG
jgi:hypothetical protein